MKLNTAYINILSGIISNPKLYYQNSNLFSEGLFSDRTMRYVYARFIAVLKEGKKPDVFNLADDNLREDIVTDIVINGELNSFSDSLVYAVDQRRREELSMVIDTAKSSLLTDSDTAGILEYIEKRLFEINDVRSSDIIPFDKQLEMFRERVKNPLKNKGIPTGYEMYDEFSGGLTKGDLIIVAGETSQGKTSLALGIGLHASKTHNVVFFSYEMTNEQLISRLVSSISSIGSKNMMHGKLQPHEIEEVDSWIDSLKTNKIDIHKCRSSDIEYLVNSIKAYKMISNTNVVIVDYLQLVNKGGGDSKADKIGYIARRLKNVAIELDITVVLLSQLSRDRDNPMPRMSRLRASGEIEEAADQVIFVYRPEIYNRETLWNGLPSKGMAEMIVAKGRNIGRETFALKFTDYLTKFDNYDAIDDSRVSTEEYPYKHEDNKGVPEYPF